MKLLAWNLITIPLTVLGVVVVTLWRSKRQEDKDLAKAIAAFVTILALAIMFVSGMAMLIAEYGKQ